MYSYIGDLPVIESSQQQEKEDAHSNPIKSSSMFAQDRDAKVISLDNCGIRIIGNKEITNLVLDKINELS